VWKFAATDKPTSPNPGLQRLLRKYSPYSTNYLTGQAVIDESQGGTVSDTHGGTVIIHLIHYMLGMLRVNQPWVTDNEGRKTQPTHFIFISFNVHS